MSQILLPPYLGRFPHFLYKLIFWPLVVPLSWLFDKVYFVRRVLYRVGFFKSYDFLVPIISIGNLAFGGTGKTPLTQWMISYFESLKLKPLVLMRGHKGELEYNSGLLSADQFLQNNPEKYGDEAILLSNHLLTGHVVVGKNRVRNLQYYLQSLNPHVVLLDDGHQHLKINRDFNIILFDALTPMELYHSAPRGFLREGPQGLSDANFVIISRSNLVKESKIEEILNYVKKFAPANTPHALSYFKTLKISSVDYSWELEKDHLKGKKVIGLAALGSPNSFFQMLEELGGELIKKISFTDHHFYQLSDLQKIIDYAEIHDALIVTTEKDIVKIRRITRHPKIYFLKVELAFTSGEEQLKEHLLSLTQFYPLGR